MHYGLEYQHASRLDNNFVIIVGVRSCHVLKKTIFISYRRTNVPWALAIYQDLTMHGYDVFFDYQSIDSGNFEKVILENIKARAHFLVILTPSALERCKEPNDWLRREIETAMDEKRNIVPLMLESFDFGSPSVKDILNGKLASLNTYNGLRVYSEYFFEAMEKLRERYLNVALSDVTLPALQMEAQEITDTQKSAASEAPQVEKEELTAQEWFERGYVFQQDKNFDEAIRCYEEVSRIQPDLSEPYINLGVLLKNLKRYEEAEASYRKAIELNPTDATAYNNLIIMLRVIGREKEALSLLEKIIEIDPENINSYLGIASIKKGAGEFIEPSFVEKARQYIPEDDFYNRACLESVCDNPDLAFEYLQKAAQKERFNPAWAWEDPDLQWVRDNPRFVEIVGPKPEK